MEANTFLKVDEQPITLSQALAYLQSSGQLSSFIGTILRQYILEQELQRNELEVNPTIIEQAVVNFRVQHQLLQPEQFQNWLASNGMTYEAFHQQVARSLKLEKLIPEVAESRIQEFFIERKVFLDRVVLSRLIVDNSELAEELKSQVLEEGASFEQLAQEYSLSNDRIFNGMMGAVSRGQLPDTLRAVIDTANPGDIVGPLAIEEKWWLFRVEQFIPASLGDEQLKQSLRNEIFEDWLGEKLQNKQVQLQLA